MRNETIDPTVAFDDLPQSLSVAEVAAHQRLGLSTVYSLVKVGVLPATRVGKSIRIARDALRALPRGQR